MPESDEPADKPERNQIFLTHDGEVKTDETWLAQFEQQVTTTFADCETPNDVCAKYNELFPEHDSYASTAALDVPTAIENQRGHCVLAMLCLGTWARERGVKVNYFPRQVAQHTIIALSEDNLKLPEDLPNTTFESLKKKNPSLKLYEYRRTPVTVPPLHELNDFMLAKIYKERKVYEAPESTEKGIMQRIGWWQGDKN